MILYCFLVFGFLGFSNLYFNFLGMTCFELGFLGSFETKLFFYSLMLIFFSIFVFCFYYFGSSLDFSRFLVIFSGFAFSMILLIFSNSVFLLFLAWDGLGVTSFFLVAYYMNWGSINGAMVTVLTNRFGDFCFFWFFCNSFLNNTWENYFWPILVLVVGCMTKSAQFPFSSWLPLAMAAPTPVSSLVHSSTLVTAGVYVCLRFYQLLEKQDILFVLFWAGMLTVILAGLSSLVETDLKKVIALSTLSQMGFLLLSISLGLPLFGFFHMITHAFFKSCLFLQVGVFIVKFFGNQDSRLFNCSQMLSLSTSFFMVSCSVSLCGLVFFSGFYSKESVLFIFSSKNVSSMLGVLLWGSMCFTFLYTIRVLWGFMNSVPHSLFVRGSFEVVLFSFFLVCAGVLGGYFLNSQFFVFFSLSGEKFMAIIILGSVCVSWQTLKISAMSLLDPLFVSLGYLFHKKFRFFDMILLSFLSEGLYSMKHLASQNNSFFSSAFFFFVFFVGVVVFY